MTKREIVEDGVLAIVVVCLFGFIFSFTHAYQVHDAQTDSVVSIKTQVPSTEESYEVHTEVSVPISYIGKVSSSTPKEEITPEEVESNLEVSPKKEKEVEIEIEDEVATSPTTKTTVITKTPPIVETPKTLEALHVQQIPNDNSYVEEVRNLIEEQTNAFRTKQKLHTLQSDSALEQNATRYSATLLSLNNLSHTDPSGCDLTCRFRQNKYEASTWGENLAMYKASALPPAEEVATYFMKEWQKSAGHRDNLVSDAFTHQGVGVSVSNGEIYVTVQFSKPLE